MSKYSVLAEYLSKQSSDHVSLTFAEIEAVLGSALPPTARTHARWWDNSNTKDSHTWAHLWLKAGWEKDELRLDEAWVSFRRVSAPRNDFDTRSTADSLKIANLDATFSVETWGGSASIYIESRGPGRNQDYLPALERILVSLAALGATLCDVLIDSRDVAGIPARARRLDLGAPYPINLSLVKNIGGFRKVLTAAAAKTGRDRNTAGGGNPTKRLRMDLNIPGCPIAVDLAASLTADVSNQACSQFSFEPCAPGAVQGPHFRSSAPPTVVEQLHVALQHQLYAALINEVGPAAVSVEQIVASGRPADIIVQRKDGLVIYEIKTASAAKDCVRQALGQLLEYAFWPGSPVVHDLVIVGPAVSDPVTERFLDTLRVKFGLPIRYQCLMPAAVS